MVETVFEYAEGPNEHISQFAKGRGLKGQIRKAVLKQALAILKFFA
jgi:hypothetical protein